PPPTALYTLSLHDALPIYPRGCPARPAQPLTDVGPDAGAPASAQAEVEGRIKVPSIFNEGLRCGSNGLSTGPPESTYGGNLMRKDRKSTRLNSSHVKISYA